jgi:hypothetical protein
MKSLEQRISDFLVKKREIQESERSGEDFDYSIPMEMMEEASEIFEDLKRDLWQPIETAPKDGSLIIVTRKWAGYHPPTPHFALYHRTAEGKEYFRSLTGLKIDGIDYWMPLPEPPKK